ncbi:MAG: ABC transporter permease [Candidatus Firestonebacteria bacterium]|nr:ABC transporter permease [Candidatus Firestonebacteria bacterium]
MIQNSFEYIGRKVTGFLFEAGRLTLLFGQVFYWTFKKPSEIKSVFEQMVIIGNKSLAVVTITSLSTGMILALQTGTAIERKISGAANMLGGIVSLALTRELAPVLIGLVMAGKIGSAIAAEIGTMAVTEQVDALKTMATNPVKYLAVPRFIAALVMLPVLTIYADLLGTLGGLFISLNIFDGTSGGYFESLNMYMRLDDVFKGIFKTVFFGAIIAVVGCHKGFETEGGAEGVGKSTTASVVISSMLILVTDYILTAFLW